MKFIHFLAFLLMINFLLQGAAHEGAPGLQVPPKEKTETTVEKGTQPVRNNTQGNAKMKAQLTGDVNNVFKPKVSVSIPIPASRT